MSNNNTTSSLLEELRLQQQCFRDEGDRLAEDALQTRIEDAQEVLRQQETGVTATAAAATASAPATSSRRCNPQADPTDRFDDRGRAWCEYHGRYTPSHSTRYCTTRQAYERRNANPGRSRGPRNMQLRALRALEDIASGRTPSGGKSKHKDG